MERAGKITRGTNTGGPEQSGVLERRHTNTNHQTGGVACFIFALLICMNLEGKGGCRAVEHISCTQAKQLEPHIGVGGV